MSKLSDEDYRSIPLNATLALAALVVIVAGMKAGRIFWFLCYCQSLLLLYVRRLCSGCTAVDSVEEPLLF